MIFQARIFALKQILEFKKQTKYFTSLRKKRVEKSI